MPKEFNRTQRLGELMQRELATLLQREVKDPRLGMVTVSDINITRDLSYAKVYVTIFAEDDVIEENIKILNQAAGFLRTMLGKRIKVRTIPQLTFVYDKSIIEGNRLSKLIDKAIADDTSSPNGDSEATPSNPETPE